MAACEFLGGTKIMIIIKVVDTGLTVPFPANSRNLLFINV